MKNIVSVFTKHIYAICSDIKNDDDKIYLDSIFSLEFPYLMSFDKYVERFMEYAGIDKEYLVGIYIYFQRLKNLDYFFTKDNIHKLFAIFAIIFSKTFPDEYYSMSFYSQVSGIPIKNLLQMEIGILFALEWDVTIDKEEYMKIYHEYEIEIEMGIETETQV
jgi:hypothetical protein